MTVQGRHTPLEQDAATTAAAARLVEFLSGELRELPTGHPWRAGYTRELIRVKARYDEDELSESA